MSDEGEIVTNEPSFPQRREGEGASLSPREGGRGIEGEGGDPMNPAIWSSRSDESRFDRSTWSGEKRFTRPEILQTPRRFEAELQQEDEE